MRFWMTRHGYETEPPQQFFRDTKPPMSHGDRPPKFYTTAEGLAWWAEYYYKLPKQNGHDGPVAWRTRLAREAW